MIIIMLNLILNWRDKLFVEIISELRYIVTQEE